MAPWEVRKAAAAIEGEVVPDHFKELSRYMDGLGWERFANQWHSPTHPQDEVSVHSDGWIHRQWGKIVATGDTPEELKRHLGESGLGEPQHQHKYVKPPLTIEGSHTAYLRARVALWKAHSKDNSPRG